MYSSDSVHSYSQEPSEEEYEVEKIVAMRKMHGRIQFLLKWKGFSDDENTWEDESKLNCPSLLEDFRLNQALEESKKKAKATEKSPRKSPKKKSIPESKEEETVVRLPSPKKIKSREIEEKPKPIEVEETDPELFNFSPLQSPEPVIEIEKPWKSQTDESTGFTDAETDDTDASSVVRVCDAFMKEINGEFVIHYVFQMSDGTKETMKSIEARKKYGSFILDYLASKTVEADHPILFAKYKKNCP